MVVKKGKIAAKTAQKPAAKTAQKPALARKKIGKKKGLSDENVKLQKKIPKASSVVAAKKGKSTAKTAEKPVLKSKKIVKTKGLSTEDAKLQKITSKESSVVAGKKGKNTAKTAQKPVLKSKKIVKTEGISNEDAKLQKITSKEPSIVTGEKRKRPSKTAQRSVLKSENVGKTEGLNNEDILLQEKISKEGLMKKGPVPKGNIALEGEEQKKFKGKNKSVKNELQKKKKPRSGGNTPGIICLSCIPHGFFEKQMLQYFSQYGDVNQVRLVRSKRTGRSCGYGYVEFRHRVVAHLVAKSMNNYLTYGKIMKCRTVYYSPLLSQKIFGMSFTKSNCPKVLKRKEAIAMLNAKRSEEHIQKRAKRAVSGLNKKMLRLQALGVNMDLNVDIGNISLKKTTQEEVPTVEKS